MAGYNQGGNDQNGLQAVLARLQAGRHGSNASNASEDSNSRDLLSRFGRNPSQGYYGQQFEGQDSPLATGADVFPPPAPTPPMNHLSHSHHPPAMGGQHLGAIGTMPPSMADKSDQSASLLHLLKNNRNSNLSQSHSNSQSSPTGPRQASSLEPPSGPLANLSNVATTIHAPVPMPADPQGMLASLIKGDGRAEHSRPEGQAAATKWNAAAPANDTQAYLLNLLQRPKPSQSDQPPTNESSQSQTLTPHSANGSVKEPAKDFHANNGASQGSTPLRAPFSYDDELVQNATSEFDYASLQNSAPQESGNGRHQYLPFEELAASSPHGQTSKSSTPLAVPGADSPHTSILKKTPSATSPPAGKHQHPSTKRSPLVSPGHSQRAEAQGTIESSPGRSRENRETVLEAINDLAQTADREAQEALARAEQEEVQARIAMDLENMMNAETDADFQEKSEVAARHIKEELEKQHNARALEDNLAPEVADAVRDIVDEAANGRAAIADSWESAEADEIVVIEETSPPVKVYNFPMKPWISISVQPNEEVRPQFRDDVILDIARVKKEFDQIDRNLVSATESYIVYGMSKAGGIRIIRQEDGRDAKIFTDTKDRIFNIAVSATHSDSNTAHKESVIGTGISGTVYYVLIREGDKDYVDDAHLEQYGFALPPIGVQEGDIPGGVLKTRARTSSTHPEYFAVSRGKTISIIWPSYIMKHNLFKPGHDRVVDTEKLSTQCALKINTGKAGKDFTFSRDDTAIVSLDKSGRVKFWDVRDLTAIDASSDPRFPVPAQTSLEVKEPLLTLNTTPEGDKAWPTSVLLLDKQRPYQKRCALRYMIVGMKQNHTLQLWDLALGKPVQEFNLPHSNESDAVCSVMYHPPTGMIVVGHPTRNSVYFLHLSAPKYNIKGLSQVDYIQRLIAKDSSMPEPDSTAVISGVREYSFSNKGEIRSLDMLTNPAPSGSDDDEQTLFELYAMHSKGVATVSVKQAELGWTKDNKVVAPIDALESGVVKITKLRELPNPHYSEPSAADETPSAPSIPVRLATRPGQKEPAAQSTSGQEDGPKKRVDNSSPSNMPSERKVEAPVTPINQPEKTERKARKKREKTAAPAAAPAAAEKLAAEHSNSNGRSLSPHVGPSTGNTEPKAVPVSSQSAVMPESIQSAVKQLESSIATKVNEALRDHRRSLDEELRNRDAVFQESQQKLLNLVSATLDENVQAVLTRTISDKVEDSVVPALGEVINQTISENLTKVISDQLDNKISGRISHAIQNQMQRLLPIAVGQALQKAEFAQAVTDKIVKGMSVNVEKSFLESLHSSITPAFTNLAVSAATGLVNDVQRQAAGQIEELEQRLQADSNKIDQLTAVVTRLSDTMSSMATAQARFQDGFLKMQQQHPRDRQASQNTSQYSQPSRAPSYATQQSQLQGYDSPSAHSGNQMVAYPSENRNYELDRKIAEIQGQVNRGELEGALVKWLQSSYKNEIFGEYLAGIPSQNLNDMSPLVSLAVLAELARDLNGKDLHHKISWMEVIILSILSSLPQIEPEVREVMPNILGGFVSQIEHLFMRVSNTNPSDPILKHLSGMVTAANRITDQAKRPAFAGW